MNLKRGLNFCCFLTAILSANLGVASQIAAADAQAPALDLSIKYYDRAMTAEGVLRESSFEENMLRRPNHVWVSRKLPNQTNSELAHEGHKESHEHKHFNPALLPRHIELNSNGVRLEYIDRKNKEVINIVSTEFENVGFDGSWHNSFYLVSPKVVESIPQSNKASEVKGAHWHEQVKDGVFRRILWDERNQIPLEIETGKQDGSIFRRVSVKISPTLLQESPWERISGFTRKEYSDFLD